MKPKSSNDPHVLPRRWVLCMVLAAGLVRCFGQTVVQTETYQYYDSGGLATVSCSWGTNQTVFHYEYDLAGNRTLETTYGPGSGRLDLDANGLPDQWELAALGPLGQSKDTVAANGCSLWQNYVAGTNPNNTNSLFRVSISLSNRQAVISFYGIVAAGAGYEGLNRFYSIESTAIPGSIWLGVPGFTNMAGNNQPVTCVAPATNPVTFYRVTARLAEP